VYDNLVSDPYQSAIVVDARTGRILFERRAAAYAYPASITKLMTMLIVLEHVQARQISLTDKVAITKEACGVGGSQVYLDTRESGAFTVDDLLYALMVHSANDAAAALAIHVSGSVDAFVEEMNRHAHSLGMASTTYHTPHGLPPDGGKQPDISTAYDIALLSLEALRHEDTLRYSGTSLTYLPLTPIRDQKFMLANRNTLVRGDVYPGCDGLKTGYHIPGGFSLAATATKNGRRIIAVALGCPDKATRTEQVTNLLNAGFQALEN
jgi:D-alanyl-D-alanine carboxypeptidase (penicillin-binding protein 5/6)